VSLQNRDSFILHGGDALMRLAAFWAMFLPLGACWSVDARNRTEDERPTAVFSAASFALMAQFAAVFFFTFLLKSNIEWKNGTAILHALNVEQLATPVGTWLAQYPALLKLLTHVTLWIEGLVPLLLFFPWRSQQVRSVAVLVLLALQMAFGFCLRLGHFPFIATAVCLALLPAWFWKQGRKDVPQEDGPPLIRGEALAWNVIAGFFLIYMLWINVATALPRPTLPIPSLALATRLDQEWDMFASSPIEEDGWYVMPGVTRDGQPVDMMKRRLGPVSWLKPTPKQVFWQYPSERWATYMLDLHKDLSRPYRGYFGEYLCRVANEGRKPADPLRLAQVDVWFVQRPDLLNHSPYQQFPRQFVLHQNCE